MQTNQLTTQKLSDNAIMMPLMYSQDSPADPLEPHRTHQGFLAVPAVIGKPGVVKYLQADGSIRRELRPADELARAVSTATARGIPVTNGHPPRSEFPLNPTNVLRYEVGHVGHVAACDDGSVRADMTIRGQSAIDAIAKGKRQLSPGYLKRLDWTPGTWTAPDGSSHQYDAVQRDIIYDHVAIVDVARGGPGVAMNIAHDGVDHEIEPGAPASPKTGGPKVPVNLQLRHGVSVSMDDAGAAGLIQADLAKRDQEIAELKKANESLTASLDTKDAELTKLQEQLAETKNTPPGDIQKAVKERLALERSAREILGEKIALDSADDLEVMKQVVAKVHPTMAEKVKDASEDYVRAAFDAAVDSAAANDDAAARRKAAAPVTPAASASTPTPTHDADDGLTARQKWLAKQDANRYKSVSEIVGGR